MTSNPRIIQAFSALTRLAVSIAAIVTASGPAAAADPAPFDRFTAESVNHLMTLQNNLERNFHLGRYQHYHWSQNYRQLLFSDNGSVKVVCTVQFVGDVSKISHTWLWAWANSSVLPSMKKGAFDVKQYGIAHHYSALTTAEWPADDNAGWDMTAIAAKVLHAKGAYRSPGKHGDEFMVITDIRWAKPGRHAKR
jgi:hypothetical protein